MIPRTSNFIQRLWRFKQDSKRFQSDYWMTTTISKWFQDDFTDFELFSVTLMILKGFQAISTSEKKVLKISATLLSLVWTTMGESLPIVSLDSIISVNPVTSELRNIWPPIFLNSSPNVLQTRPQSTIPVYGDQSAFSPCLKYIFNILYNDFWTEIKRSRCPTLILDWKFLIRSFSTISRSGTLFFWPLS